MDFVVIIDTELIASLKSVVTELMMKDLVDSQGLLLFISTFFINDGNRIFRFADTGELVSCIQDSKRFNADGKWSIPTR